MSNSFITNQQTNGSIALLSGMIALLIFGKPVEITDTFNILFFTSLFGIIISKFDIIEYLVKQSWISKRIEKSYNIPRNWMKDHLSNEYSKPIFEKINSEFYLSLSLLIGAISLLVQDIFSKLTLNLIISSLLLSASIGLIFRGRSTAFENVELLRDIVRFGRYQSEATSQYPWVLPISSRLMMQNEILSKRNQLIQQLQKNLIGREFKSFSHNFNTNMCNIAKSNGEQFIRHLLGYRYYENPGIDLEWYHSKLNRLPETISEYYLSGYGILNQRNYQTTQEIENLTEYILKHEFTLTLFKDFCDYILRDLWLETNMLNVNDVNNIPITDIEVILNRIQINQVGKNKSKRSEYFDILLNYIVQLYHFFGSSDPLEIKTLSKNNITYINKIILPRDKSTKLELPIQEIEILIFCWKFKIFNNVVYGCYNPEPLDHILMTLDDDLFGDFTYKLLKDIEPITKDIHTEIFPDFMEYRRDKNKGISVYSYNKFVNDLNDIFEGITNYLHSIDELQGNIDKL